MTSSTHAHHATQEYQNAVVYVCKWAQGPAWLFSHHNKPLKACLLWKQALSHNLLQTHCYQASPSYRYCRSPPTTESYFSLTVTHLLRGPFLCSSPLTGSPLMSWGACVVCRGASNVTAHKCKNSTSNISAALKIEAHHEHTRCSVLKNTHRLRSFFTEALWRNVKQKNPLAYPARGFFFFFF